MYKAACADVGEMEKQRQGSDNRIEALLAQASQSGATLAEHGRVIGVFPVNW